MKKLIENISSLIEGWCKKKIVFAHALLPFGTVGEAYAHCTHLQIAQADPQTQNLQKSTIFANPLKDRLEEQITGHNKVYKSLGSKWLN